MYLHRRDAKAVAAAGGMYHVAPAGNASSPRNSSATPNTTANGIDPIDYDTEEPFVSFERARQSGGFRVFACATVLEPLTLWAELLTVAVIAAPVFDKLFSGMVAIDEEVAAISTEAGRPTTGIPFAADARQRLKNEPLSPISRACIELAWQHRNELLC